jgi:Fur family ferric uptake transcriptional regulator
MPGSADLKHLGLKATLARLWVLNVFEAGPERHLSAEEVYHLLDQGGRRTSLATVYRVLAQLEQAGLLRHQRFASGKAVYELDDGQHHDHLVCLRCGRVQEFHDGVIEQRQKRLAQDYGFDIVEHSHVLYGQCTQAGCRHLAALQPGSTA